MAFGDHTYIGPTAAYLWRVRTAMPTRFMLVLRSRVLQDVKCSHIMAPRAYACVSCLRLCVCACIYVCVRMRACERARGGALDEHDTTWCKLRGAGHVAEAKWRRSRGGSCGGDTPVAGTCTSRHHRSRSRAPHGIIAQAHVRVHVRGEGEVTWLAHASRGSLCRGSRAPSGWSRA